MNGKQLAQHIGNIDEALVEEAREVPNYALRRRKATLRLAVSLAAVLALMLCSGAVGAVAFRQETEVRQETVELTELGLTLILPEDWAGRYEVVEDTFAPYGTPMWSFHVKRVYDAKVPLAEGTDLCYQGLLFTVFQYADTSLSADLPVSAAISSRRRTPPMPCSTPRMFSLTRRTRPSRQSGRRWRRKWVRSVSCLRTC